MSSPVKTRALQMIAVVVTIALMTLAALTEAASDATTSSDRLEASVVLDLRADDVGFDRRPARGARLQPVGDRIVAAFDGKAFRDGAAGGGPEPDDPPDASIPINSDVDPELAAGMLEELMMSIREEAAAPSFVSPADAPYETRALGETDVGRRTMQASRPMVGLAPPTVGESVSAQKTPKKARHIHC